MSMSLKPPPFREPSQPQSDEDYDFDVTIRFSASLPDLLLSIPASLNANTATLKQLIRSRIPDEFAKHRIRLIHAGKALIDDVPLSSSLKRNVSRPPSRIGTPGPYDERLNGAAGRPTTSTTGGREDVGKGKQPSRNPPSQLRIYIHCSIGDIVLSGAELAAEAAIAATASTKQPQDEASSKPPPTTTTVPAPRGFDRLLNSGFSTAEVQPLRLQFLAIQAHTHTPDTMPSPNTLRDMEDRWLDNSNATGSDLNPDGAVAGGGIGDDDMQAGALDDMIWGTAMGFFWPVGCLMWGVREEGIWSQRRKMAVAVGFLLNIGIGLIRYTG